MSERFASLDDIDAFVAEQSSPFVVPNLPLRPGGVDPLGLRQLNFDLMDLCIPGLNNAAWRLRPYALIAWAWWRAGELAAQAGIVEPPVDLLKSFVDRVETLFAATHLLANEFDGLPGRDTLNARVIARGGYDFSCEDWQTFRRSRRETVSLMAPVSYGPSAKVGRGLGYLNPVQGAFAPVEEVVPAVRAVNDRLSPVLDLPAFASLECGWISTEQMVGWHSLWRMEDLTEDELAVGRERLIGARAPARASTVRLMRRLLSLANEPLETDELRRQAAHSLAPFADDPSAIAWRTLQARQLLRIALEGLLNWVLNQCATPHSLDELVEQLLAALGQTAELTFEAWLDGPCITPGGTDPVLDPVGLIYEIRAARQVDEPSLCATGLRAAVKICRAMGGEVGFGGQSDRLPLERLSARMAEAANLPLSDGFYMLIAEWLVGQHVYWAVGRSGDDTQRLRIILDEAGWISLVARPGNAEPTPDRLFTLMELCADCRLVERIRNPGSSNSYRWISE